MARAKKSGRITLRIRPELHEQLAEIADDMWIDINGLLNLMIRRALGPLKIQAHLFREQTREGRYWPLYKAWRQLNPTAHWREFDEELVKHLLGEPSTLDAIIKTSQTVVSPQPVAAPELSSP
jgi:hypothetical protein